MTAGAQTRQRLLRSAGELFRSQGYAATGLNQVVADSGSPKGVLYFHFPGGKAQLAAEAVALTGADLGARMAAAMAGATDIRGAMTALGDLFAADLEASGYLDGCPVASVALDGGDRSQPVLNACAAVYAAWLAGLATYLNRQGVPAAEAAELAALIFTSLQGALLLARVQRDVAVLRTVTRQLGDLADRAALRPARPRDPGQS
jgi:TetR/AcrR family transcriptional repressor of lmrAB and yxaGH operons